MGAPIDTGATAVAQYGTKWESTCWRGRGLEEEGVKEKRTTRRTSRTINLILPAINSTTAREAGPSIPNNEDEARDYISKSWQTERWGQHMVLTERRITHESRGKLDAFSNPGPVLWGGTNSSVWGGGCTR